MNTIDGDFYFRGRLRSDNLDVPADSIGSTNFDATDPLVATKQIHQYRDLFRQPHGTAAVARRETVHVAYATGALIGVRIQVAVAAIGAATVTIDLLKNGVTVLTAPKVIDNTLTVYTTDVGAIATPAYVAGDNFELNITVAAGGGTLPQGLSVETLFREESGA